MAGGGGGGDKAEVFPGVTRLDKMNFTEYMVDAGRSDTLIEFFAPWCGACKAFAPAYAQAAALAKGRNLPVVLAAIDTEANKKLAAQYRIEQLPTLIYFPWGAKTAIPYDKKAPRTPEKIVEWLEIMVGDAVKAIKSPAALPELESNSAPRVLLRAPSVPKHFKAVATKMRQWARWYWLEEVAEEGGPAGRVELVHFGQEAIEHEIADLSARDDKLEEFLAANHNPQLTPVLKPKKFYEGADPNGQGIVWVCLDGSAQTGMDADKALEQALTPAWRKMLRGAAGELALGHQGRQGHRIVYLDATRHERWLEQELYAFEFPQIVVQNRPRGERYHMPRGEMPEPSELVEFARSIMSLGGPQAVRRSESPARVQQEGGKNWEKFVARTFEERLRSVPGTVVYVTKRGRPGERMEQDEFVLDDEFEALDDLAKWLKQNCETPPLVGSIDVVLNEVPSSLVKLGFFSVLSAPALVYVPNDGGVLSAGYWGKKLRIFNSTKLQELKEEKGEKEDKLMKQDLRLLTKDLSGAASWILKRARKTPGLVVPAEDAGVSFWGGAKSSPVVQWTAANFDQELKSKGTALIDLYLPDCGACGKFAPVFEAAARGFQRNFHLSEDRNKQDVTFAKVDCEPRDGDILATKYGVDGYPTLLFMRKGFVAKYSGDMGKQDILEWLDREMAPDWVEVESQHDVWKRLAAIAPRPAVVFQGDRGSIRWSTFEATSKKAKHRYAFFAVKDLGLAGRQVPGIPKVEDIFLIRKSSQMGYAGSDIQQEYGAKAAGLALWLAEKTALSQEPPAEKDQVGHVQVIVTKTMREKLFRAGKHVLLEVYAEWCTHCKQFAPIYEQFAERMQREQRDLIVAKLDGDKNDIPYQGFEMKGYPALFYMMPKDRKPTEVTARTFKDLLEFVKQREIPELNETADIERATMKFMNLPEQEPGTREEEWMKNFRSEEPLDEDQEEAEIVKTAVLKNFAKVVFHADQHTAVMIHDTKCPHCVATMPEFEDYAEEVQDEAELDMAFVKIDGTKNDVPFQGFKAKGFPTIWFIKAGEKAPCESWVGRGCLKQLKAHVSRLHERDEL